MTPTSTTMTLNVKTPLQEEREARDMAIYKEYHTLIADPEQSRTQVVRYLMDKYKFYSNGTVYAILKREEERLNRQQSLAENT